jgi:hypothetical protein
MAVGDQWLKNHRETSLWANPAGDSGWIGKMPQFSVFKRTGPQEGERIPVQYFGSSTVNAINGYVTALDLGPVGPPPTIPPAEPEWDSAPDHGGRWLQNHRETSLLDGPTGPTDGGPAVRQWTIFAQLGPQKGARIPVYHFGGSRVAPRAAWVTALDLGPIPEPAELPRPDPDIAEPPPIIQAPSPNHAGFRQVTLGCVIHATQGEAESVEQEFQGTLNHFGNAANEVSSHIVIAHDGTIAEVVDPDLIAWHAGFHNDEYLGVELVQPNLGLEITDDQLRSCAWWLTRMSGRYGFELTEENLPEHRNTAQGISVGKTDVDEPYTFARLKAFLDAMA